MARKGRRRGRRMLGLLGMAGLGFAASRLRHHGRHQTPPDRRPRRRPRVVPHARPPVRLELPEAAELHWLPTADGSVAFATVRHATWGGEGLGVGAAGPVVFVHGLGGCLEHWSSQLLDLAPGRLGVAVDLPGHGRSDRPSEPTIAALAAALDVVIQAALEAEREIAPAGTAPRCLLVAHSFGALPALEVAAQAPERIEGVLLVDPNGDQTEIPSAERRAFLETLRDQVHDELEWTWRQFLVDSTPEATEAVVEQLRATPPPVLLGLLEAGMEHSPLPALDRLLERAPSRKSPPVRLVLSPLNDLPYSLHRLRPDLPFQVLPGGHWLMLDRPDELSAILSAFDRAPEA